MKDEKCSQCNGITVYKEHDVEIELKEGTVRFKAWSYKCKDCGKITFTFDTAYDEMVLKNGMEKESQG